MRPKTRSLLTAALLTCAGLGCAAATASSPTAVPALPEMDAAGHEKLGDVHTSQGNLERAYLEYREALRREPQRHAAGYKAARILLRRGLLAEARSEFAALLEAQPGEPLALLGMGHAAFLAGELDAEQLLRDALARDSELWQAHNLLGLLYDREGSTDKAIVEFSAALELKPSDGCVSNNLGVALLRSGNAEAAAKTFARAIDAGCANPKVSNNLGLALARLGFRDEALRAFRRSGSAAAALNNLGFALLVEGKNAEATEAFNKAIEAEAGYFDRAHENLRRALAVTPSPQVSAPPAPATP